ncbi:MAG TPA: DMT family transporter [Flavisolibacter sp.]|jgi:drug/metabolite transporter (DMT)-like permease|nr:DMT family transporter [Flavisolibacter sp.]
MSRQKSSSWVLFVLLALVWGSSFILIKKASVQLTGWQIGAIRIFSAGIVFLPFALFHISKLPKSKVPLIILTGLLGNLFPAFLFAIAIHQKIESSVAGILNSLTPLFVIVIGVLFFKSKVAPQKFAGVLIGFVGLLLLSITRGPVSISDIGFTLLILLATILYGVNVNLVGTYLKGLDPIKMATVSIGFLTLPTAIVLWLNPVSFSSAQVWNGVLASVALGFLGSAAATILFYMLIKKAGGLFASLVTYAIPVVAIAWGMVDGENISLVQLGCLGIILCGVYLANK